MYDINSALLFARGADFVLGVSRSVKIING